MTDIQNTLNELKNITTYLKTKADAGTVWTGTEKADIEKRIAHVNDKTKDHHTNLAAPLKLDTKDLNNLDQTIVDDKLKWAEQKKKLEEERDEAKKLTEKLTPEFLTSLDSLVKTGLKKPKKNADGTDQKDKDGNIIYEELIDTTKLTEIKAVIEELKTKNITADLTPTNTKIEELKGTITKASEEKGLPTWVGYAGLVTGLVSCCLVFYNIFLKDKTSKKIDE